MRTTPLMLLSIILFGCPPKSDDVATDPTTPDTEDPGTTLPGTDAVPEFGSEPTFTVLAKKRDGLAIPRDLEFHPDRPDELWIASRGDDSITVVWNPGMEDETMESFYDRNANHFLEEVSSIAFSSDNGDWGSCQESRNTYDDQAPPNDFMGPALWPGDLDIFAQVNQTFSSDLLGSHLDMLHQSPNCMGIAYDAGNAYWVFDGFNKHLVYYDFQQPHEPGGEFHGDGIVRRYPEVVLDRVADVPGHMELDPSTLILYIADTGTGRVLAVDTASGEVTGSLPLVNEPLEEFSEVTGVDHWVVAEGFQTPSGLALHEGRLFVGDHDAGEIVALDLDGNELGRIPTVDGGGVMGIEVGPDGWLYYADGVNEKVIRVDPDGGTPPVR